MWRQYRSDPPAPKPHPLLLLQGLLCRGVRVHDALCAVLFRADAQALSQVRTKRALRGSLTAAAACFKGRVLDKVEQMFYTGSVIGFGYGVIRRERLW